MGIYRKVWIGTEGIKRFFEICTLAVIGNKAGWFSIEETLLGVGSATVFIIAGSIWSKLRKKG